jgi:hypothetical protein
MKISRRHLLLPAIAVACLAACSGSLYIGYDGSSEANSPDARPTVSLASSAETLTQAGTITLIAAAADDHGIVDVRFYSLDGNIQNLLGTVASLPYRRTVALTRANNGPVYFFARARDTADQSADSPAITVMVSIP